MKTYEQQKLMDELVMGQPRQISAHMYRMVQPLSDIRPAAQLQAVVVLFLMMTSKYGINPRFLLEVGDQILNDAERTDNEHIRAFRMYMENEL